MRCASSTEPRMMRSWFVKRRQASKSGAPAAALSAAGAFDAAADAAATVAIVAVVVVVVVGGGGVAAAGAVRPSRSTVPTAALRTGARAAAASRGSTIMLAVAVVVVVAVAVVVVATRWSRCSGGRRAVVVYRRAPHAAGAPVRARTIACRGQTGPTRRRGTPNGAARSAASAGPAQRWRCCWARAMRTPLVRPRTSVPEAELIGQNGRRHHSRRWLCDHGHDHQHRLYDRQWTSTGVEKIGVARFGACDYSRCHGPMIHTVQCSIRRR